MDESNVKAVRELVNREFKTIGEVRQLLGLIGFHRRHVQDFASIAKPLTDLLCEKTDEKKGTDGKIKKGVAPSQQKIIWRKDHQEALENLIHQITNPPDTSIPGFQARILCSHGCQCGRPGCYPLPKARRKDSRDSLRKQNPETFGKELPQHKIGVHCHEMGNY